MLKQRTLNQSIHITDIGLHSGKDVTMRCQPADVDTGIIFRRVDLTPVVDIPANALLIEEAFMCSNLVKNGQKVGTVEHVMSALAALGIDNLIIEVDAAELPIVDGSAKPFIDLFLTAGIKEQDAAKKFIKIKKPVYFQVGDKTAAFEPSDDEGFSVEFKIDFQHPVFTPDLAHYQFQLHSGDYIQHISPARTFGFAKDLEKLHQMNLALGASLANAIGLDEKGVLNPEGLRFKNEFVRHKILDAVGDLYMLGHQILGKFIGFKAGHAVNNELLRQLICDPSQYEMVTFEHASQANIRYITD